MRFFCLDVRSLRTPLVAFVPALAWCGLAQAAPPPNITPTETSLLPAYCRDTQTWPNGNPGGMERGKAIYGEVFWHFHHYCYAMVWMMRADKATNSAMERRGNLAGAVDDIDYVLKYIGPDYFLLPEMLTRKGRVLRMQERYREAIDVLRQAADQDPTYWRAYLELANTYEAAGDRKQAIGALREGLVHSPESKGLKFSLTDLEGNTAEASKRAEPGKPGQKTVQVRSGASQP
jgi:hypothetical protein